ncbi:MAG: hypothetical protein LBB15_02655 [Puniceicoccales bacterium]|jgi:hypothetical protein|nr:hypothetical protein [Puniceicoccales bacterium]
MDTKLINSYGQATLVNGEIEKQSVEIKSGPAIESVTDDVGQLAPHGRLYLETPLGERHVDTVSEREAPEPVNSAIAIPIMEDGEIKKSIELATDILSHPEKTKGFGYGNKSLGKKASKDKLFRALKKLENEITQENRHNLNPIKNLMEQAHKDVSKKLNASRVKKAVTIGIPVVSGIASIVATAATLGAGAAITVPVAIAAGAAIAGAAADSGKSILKAAAQKGDS